MNFIIHLYIQFLSVRAFILYVESRKLHNLYFVLHLCIYDVCPEGIHPCSMKNRDIY